MFAFCQNTGFVPLVVATKTDKLKQKEKSKQWKKINEVLDLYFLNNFIPFSAKSGLGKFQVWRWIEEKLSDHE